MTPAMHRAQKREGRAINRRENDTSVVRLWRSMSQRSGRRRNKDRESGLTLRRQLRSLG